jgi:hypothetical protein
VHQGAVPVNQTAAETPIRKRPAQEGSTPLQSKRPRSTKHRNVVVTRTITFEEVHREAIDRIAPYPPGSQNFYIFRCDKHPTLRFQKGRPVHGAARHLASQAHVNGTKYHWRAVQELGVRVTLCDAAKVDEHNRSLRMLPRISLKASPDKATSQPQAVDDHSLGDGDEDYAEPMYTDSDSEGDRNDIVSYQDDESVDQRGGDNIFEPLVGEVCIAKWPKKTDDIGRRYAAVRLSLGRLTALALKGSIVNTNLLTRDCFKESAKKCYTMKDKRPVGWHPAFRSGGSRVIDRHYAFLFLESGLYFKPSGPLHIADLVEGHRALGWVHQDSIRPLTPQDPVFPQLAQQGTMRHYLERLRNIRGLSEAAQEQLTAIYNTVGQPTSGFTQRLGDVHHLVGCSHTVLQLGPSEPGSHSSEGNQPESRASSFLSIYSDDRMSGSSDPATNECRQSHSMATQSSLKGDLSECGAQAIHDERNSAQEQTCFRPPNSRWRRTSA